MIRMVEGHKRTDQWTRDGGQYVPAALTYLNQGRYNDDPDDLVAPAADPVASILTYQKVACRLVKALGITEGDAYDRIRTDRQAGLTPEQIMAKFSSEDVPF